MKDYECTRHKQPSKSCLKCRLRASDDKIMVLSEALYWLVDCANTSNAMTYGTLSTGFVKGVAEEALKEAGVYEKLEGK